MNMEVTIQNLAEKDQEILKLQHIIAKYENGIRRHRQSYIRGDDKCWKDNETLYQLLPEGFEIPKRDEACELKNCEKYIASCHHPGVTYTSPQDRLEWLLHLLKDASYFILPLPQNELLREQIQQELKGDHHVATGSTHLDSDGHS
jgi:hypothetical protein